MNTTKNDGRRHYTTAQAAIGCARFKAGDFVKVQFSHDAPNGVAWYAIDYTQHGPIDRIMYPDHHLTRFTI